jgi:hypothetical protein
LKEYPDRPRHSGIICFSSNIENAIYKIGKKQAPLPPARRVANPPIDRNPVACGPGMIRERRAMVPAVTRSGGFRAPHHDPAAG